MNQCSTTIRESFVTSFTDSDSILEAVLSGIPSEKQIGSGDLTDLKLDSNLLMICWIFISGRMIPPLGFISVVIMSYE